MKDFIQGMYRKKNFRTRLILVLLAVTTMGFALSWLVLVDFGTDPCSLMNLAIADKLGLTLGTWQALFNCFLFLFVIAFGRDNIGFGTLANMFLVGYSFDLFSWIWSKVLPEEMFKQMWVRIVVLIVALIIFIFAAAVYMDVKLGTAPYDAIPFMIANRQRRFSFRIIRMCFDFCVILIGCLFDGKVGVVTILMALTLGPVIEFIGHKLSKLVPVD
ncbi:MAG: hypothetical protein E7294_04900 [Lachnospiraceae bacterium]|nr:hypothetical protein [Lachnospiraceae bacterium]